MCTLCNGTFKAEGNVLCKKCCYTLWCRLYSEGKPTSSWQLCGWGSQENCESSQESITNETVVLPPGEFPYIRS